MPKGFGKKKKITNNEKERGTFAKKNLGKQGEERNCLNLGKKTIEKCKKGGAPLEEEMVGGKKKKVSKTRVLPGGSPNTGKGIGEWKPEESLGGKPFPSKKRDVRVQEVKRGKGGEESQKKRASCQGNIN